MPKKQLKKAIKMKNNVRNIFLAAFVAMFFSACAEPKIYDYSALLQSRPKSILVLMPTNETTEINASPAVLANAVRPLAEAGYYVFSPALVNDTFKRNGIYEADEIAKISLAKIRQIFDADAVLYMHVTRYGTNYAVVSSSTVVSVSASLVDARTGTKLWEGSASASDDQNSGNGGGLLGMLITAVVNQIANTVADKSYDLSVSADAYLFATGCNECILYGPYSPKYGQDPQLAK